MDPSQAQRPCETLKNYLPGLSYSELTDPAYPGALGCRATGRTKALASTDNYTFTRVGDRYVLQLPFAGAAFAAASRPANLPGPVAPRASITLPNSIDAHDKASTVVGATATWADLRTIGFTEGAWVLSEPPPSVVPVWLATIPGVLVGAGLMLALGVRRRTLERSGSSDAA